MDQYTGVKEDDMKCIISYYIKPIMRFKEDMALLVWRNIWLNTSFISIPKLFANPHA